MSFEFLHGVYLQIMISVGHGTLTFQGLIGTITWCGYVKEVWELYLVWNIDVIEDWCRFDTCCKY
ncbi:hypothetical protein L208DRAFT_1412735, partial [Tricholoma matsutake]